MISLYKASLQTTSGLPTSETHITVQAISKYSNTDQTLQCHKKDKKLGIQRRATVNFSVVMEYFNIKNVYQTSKKTALLKYRAIQSGKFLSVR